MSSVTTISVLLTGLLAAFVPHATAGAATAATSPAPARVESQSPYSAKKGWAGGKPETAREMHCSWFYNWGLHGASRDGLEFVPMVKGLAATKEKNLARLTRSGAKHLLGFNEPERRNQGNTSVEEALDAWPKLMATGLRLGSPAPSSDRAGMEWLHRFMEGVEKRNLRVDFIAVHYYRSADAQQFDEWLDDLYRRYKRPIWVTEFNAKFTDGDRDRFAHDAFKMLERHLHVERFAYMNGFVDEPGALFTSKPERKPTRIGEQFRDL